MRNANAFIPEGRTDMIARIRPVWLGMALLILSPAAASARPVRMMETFPQAEAVTDGRNATYAVRFDGLVDHRAAILTILQNDRVVRTLHPSLSAAANVLSASTPRLPPGAYKLAWSVLSIPDGDRTEGAIAFTVHP
jgi:methionine-rich copper-binding protein CopC